MVKSTKSANEYLVEFYLAVLVKILDSPDELLDEMTAAIALVRERQQEITELLEKARKQRGEKQSSGS